MDTSTKTTSAILADVPSVMTTLLMRFERDAQFLCDHKTRDEQEKWLGHIEYGIRNKLLLDRRWNHEMSNLVAAHYRRTLVMRLAHPQFFKTPSPLEDLSMPPKLEPELSIKGEGA